jgi:CDP-paratose 2-epimerase
MKVLVTGGLGFIGSNYVKQTKNECTIADLYRREKLNDYNDFRLNKKFLMYDVACPTNWDFVLNKFSIDAVIHLAAQVAVTTSIEEPVNDFDTNARGTLNILEAVRRYAPKAHVIYASTNKVYGDEPTGHFKPSTPYGVSKAVGDLYCQEYAKTYGIRTTVLRQSCIYGPHQDYTSVDQGWVCHIAGQIIQGKPVTIFGDGTQVRDLLYVDDLVELYDYILDKGITGVYDIGGGHEKAVSVNEAIGLIEAKTGKVAERIYKPWRLHDQKYYVSNITKILNDTQWHPKMEVKDGICKMVENIVERAGNG